MPTRLTSRISIVGFHRSIMGLGEDARTLADTCIRIGLQTELVDVSPPSLKQSHELLQYRPLEKAIPSAEIIVFCLPPGEMRRACSTLGIPNAPSWQHRIGYWPWETSMLPTRFQEAFHFVDELWASSTFLLDVYRDCRRVPVRKVPLSVTVDKPAPLDEFAALLDGRFTVLTVFDFHSRISRKNPAGAVLAFRRAFPLGTEPVQMIVKTINGEHRRDDLARLLAATFEDPRIVVVDGAVDRAALCGLIACSDVYLSLHRAEGFGRPVAEAMLLDTPVIATRWSGTADFLDETTGYPVPSQLRPVLPGEYPEVAGLWAEPDVDWAASALTGLWRHPSERRKTCATAYQRVTQLFGHEAVSRAIVEALRSLQQP